MKDKDGKNDIPLEQIAIRKIIDKGGRPRLYEDGEADRLAKEFDDYCEWCKAHPMTVKGEKVPRPLTLSGFCAFAGICSKWKDFRRNYANREGFLAVIKAIENAVETQQVGGAMVGLYNSNLTARLNGITEHVDHTSDGEKLDLTINLK